MQQQHGQSGAELGIINIQQTSYDERRDNGANSAGWSTAGRRWGACARHRPRELRDRLILMDGYIDDDDDDGVDDDDIDGGDAVGVFRFFLLAPGGGGGGGDGERDGEVQSVSRSLVEVAEGTEKAAVPGSRLES